MSGNQTLTMGHVETEVCPSEDASQQALSLPVSVFSSAILF